MSDNEDTELRAAAAREYVRGLAADERRQFDVETRPPVTAEQLKSVAAQILSGDQLDAFASTADPSKFTNDDGEIDEATVMGKLTALFGVQPQERRNWGQRSGGPAPGDRPGDAGRREAAKRFGGDFDDHNPNPHEQQSFRRGAGGRAEAERRFGKKGDK